MMAATTKIVWVCQFPQTLEVPLGKVVLFMQTLTAVPIFDFNRGTLIPHSLAPTTLQVLHLLQVL